MTVLPRFHTTSTPEGPAVADREQGLRATFETLFASQRVARLLNANPAMVDAFHWTNDNQGDTQ